MSIDPRTIDTKIWESILVSIMINAVCDVYVY